MCDPTQPSLFSEPDAAQFAIFLKHNDGAISLMEAVVILIMNPNCAPADFGFPDVCFRTLCLFLLYTPQHNSICMLCSETFTKMFEGLRACTQGCTSLCQCVPQRVLEISESFKAANQ